MAASVLPFAAGAKCKMKMVLTSNAHICPAETNAFNLWNGAPNSKYYKWNYMLPLR
jgi:hypothetical protein